MVQLRKRPAPAAPSPQPTKKKATAKQSKAKQALENAAAGAEQDGAKPGPAPKTGDSIALSNFGGEVETLDGTKVTFAKLLEDSKNGVVLFTYPKASTPGCTRPLSRLTMSRGPTNKLIPGTTQACLFRDSYTPLTATGLSIYGLSTDSPKSNTTFKTKQNLPYALLCDPAGTLVEAIGMKKAPKGTTRGVFVVDKSGKVLAAEAGGPAATVEVVKGVTEKMGGQSDAKPIEKAGERAVAAEGSEMEDEKAATTAAEVADTAQGIDASAVGTPA